MDVPSSSIVIVGAGGIGCAVGHALLHAGLPVTFVEANPDKVDWGNRHGVQVDGWPALPARFVPFADWTPAAGDTIILCTKCYDNDEVLTRVPATAKLVPIQNGFDPALEARRPALEGIASFISECYPGQTRTRITRPGKLHLGSLGQEACSLGPLEKLCPSTLFQVEVAPDILPYKYAKLMYNAAISPLAAAGGLDNGQLLAVPRARRLFFSLLRENYAILAGTAIRLARIGPFHPKTVNRILRCRPLASAMAWAFYPSLRKTYCSMSGDLPAGRTEIDYYNRHLIDLAGERPCPINRQVFNLIKRMERDRIRPEVKMLDELVA